MSLITLLPAETHELAPLIWPTWVFPIITTAFFLLAGLVSWSFRDVWHRHADKVADSDSHGGHH